MNAASATFLDGRVVLHRGDSRDVLRTLADSSIDSVVCDPPYALVSIVKRFGAAGAAPAIGDHAGGAYARAAAGFMGQSWDTGETAFADEFWAEVLRVLKPGGHVVAFSGTRTYHRLAVAIEDAGFEIRDQLAWVYGTGFPKSHDLSKAIDRAAGATRDVVGRKAGPRYLSPATATSGAVMGNISPRANGPQTYERAGFVTAPATPEAAQWAGWPEPFLVVLRNHMSAQGMDAPLPTIAARGQHIAIAQPVIVNMKGRSAATAVTAPHPTQASHAGHLFAGEPFVMATGSTGVPRATDMPIPTITTGGAGSDDPGCARPMLVEPFVLSRHGDGAPRTCDEPTPTQVAKHSHVLISPYYGSGSGESCTEAEAPLPTVTSKGRFGMVVPITHADGGHRARDIEADPLPTITTTHRGEFAFIAAQFGEREGQAPRVHDIEEPAPTLCATGRINLVEGTERYDILFRMLEPHELAAAMGFEQYEFTGTKTEKIKQIGNAVSVRKMEACVGAIMADAAIVEGSGLGVASGCAA